MLLFSAIDTTCGETTCGETSVCVVATDVCFGSNRALKEGRKYRERGGFSCEGTSTLKLIVLEVG